MVDLVAKVQRLMRLAQSSNEHEAANAKAHADAIINKHGDAVVLKPVTFADDPKWVHELTRVVAEYMLCTVEETTGDLYYTGDRADIDDGRELLEYLGELVFDFTHRQSPIKNAAAQLMCVDVLRWLLVTEGEQGIDDADRPDQLADPMALDEHEAKIVVDFWNHMLESPPGAMALSFITATGDPPVWIVRVPDRPQRRTRLFVESFFNL